MSHLPRISLWKPPIAAWAATLLSAGFVQGQNLSLRVADPDPLGLGSFVPTADEFALGFGDGIKGDFQYGLETIAEYNSNFALTETDEDSELAVFLSPWLKYFSDPEGGALVSLTASYHPVYRAYLDHSELDGFDQSGDITLQLRGGRTDVALFGAYNELSGTDRLTGSYVSGSLFTVGIRANRQIASRTSLTAGWSASMSDYESSSDEGTELYTTYVGGFWQKTPRLSFGATVRNTMSESDIAGSRDAWALLGEIRYRLGERIWLSASLGPEYSEVSGGTADDSSWGMTGELTARYVINDRWTWRNSIRSVTVPSPSEANYQVSDVSILTALDRQFLRGSLTGGLTFSFSEYEEVGPVGTTRGNEENFGVLLGYRRNLFTERLAFHSMLRYTVNNGESDWEQILATVGLKLYF